MAPQQYSTIHITRGATSSVALILIKEQL